MNAEQVNAFNSKVQRYNQLVKNTEIEQELLNTSIQMYDGQLSSYGLKVR